MSKSKSLARHMLFSDKFDDMTAGEIKRAAACIFDGGAVFDAKVHDCMPHYHATPERLQSLINATDLILWGDNAC